VLIFSPASKPKINSMRDACIFDAVRTPRAQGKSNGAFYEVRPIDLLHATLTALQQRNQLDTSLVDDVIIGCVSPIDDQGFNIAKASVLRAGWSNQVSGMQLNRFCASGLEAINLAALKIRSGWDEFVVAGGIESMSRVPMGSDGGALIHDPQLIAQLQYLPQGVSADLIATLEGFGREDVDAYAARSQQRAAKAIKERFFARSVVPIHDQNGLLLLAEDEHPRPDTDIDQLGKLAPAFAKMGEQGFDSMALQKYPQLERIAHVHTAGNSSGIVDGAALILVGSRQSGKKLGLKPRACILSVANVSVEPTIMLTGPAPAARKALDRIGMKKEDVDLWECNEAFASVVLKFQRELDLDPDRVNVNGGAIAMGHPLGATGAMLLGTLLDELERRDLSTGCLTLCAGGGMGIATIVERL